MCPRCGNLRSECSDPTRDWHPRTSVCWPSATREWADGVLRKRHKDDELPDNELPYLAGRWVWVAEQPLADGEEDEFLSAGTG